MLAESSFVVIRTCSSVTTKCTKPARSALASLPNCSGWVSYNQPSKSDGNNAVALSYPSSNGGTSR